MESGAKTIKNNWKKTQEIKRAEIYDDKDRCKDNLTVAVIMQCVYQLTFVNNKMLL